MRFLRRAGRPDFPTFAEVASSQCSGTCGNTVETCFEWFQTQAPFTGRLGSSTLTSGQWTFDGQQTCDMLAVLYCFQV